MPAFPVERLVDTTGAGDLFAAGFLAGLSRDLDHTACARLGALAAAEVIQHIGARPQANLAELARQEGLWPLQTISSKWLRRPHWNDDPIRGNQCRLRQASNEAGQSNRIQSNWGRTRSNGTLSC